MTMPRPLPRSLLPIDGEALAGYLLRLSHRLGMPPAELAVRTGLEAKPPVPVIDAGFAVRVPPDMRAAFSTATHLADSEIVNMTISRWDGHLFDSQRDMKAARTVHGAVWLVPARSRYCPLCMLPASRDPERHAAWQITWQMPYAVACVDHAVMLLDACPGCGTPTGATGTQVTSLVPRPIAEVLATTECRAVLSDRQTVCRHELVSARTHQAPQSLLDLQARLNAVMNAQPVDLISVGVPVTPAQYLRDLRSVCVLLQLADEPAVLGALPPPFRDATLDHVSARSRRRRQRDTSDRSDRTWTQPPANPFVTGGLLLTAVSLLAQAEPEALSALVSSAAAAEPLLWGRVRATGSPSLGLERYFAPGRCGVTTTARLRSAAADRLFSATIDHIPAYLPRTDYLRTFPNLPPSAERSIRRAVPVAMARLVARCDLGEAAEALGYPYQAAETAAVRAGRALERRTDWFHQQVAGLAAALDAGPLINYGHRRTWFDIGWTLPVDAWRDLQDRLLAHKLARSDTPWAARRPAYTVWVWSLVTSGDPHVAPMIMTAAPHGRRTTGGVAQVLSTLLRDASPRLVEFVQEYAASLTKDIDAGCEPCLAEVSRAAS